MNILLEVQKGILNLQADNDDRFVCLVGTKEVGLNYIKSFSPDVITMARGFKIEGNKEENRLFTNKLNGLLMPSNVVLNPLQRWFLLRISKFTNSNESDMSFLVQDIINFYEELWQPNIITDKPDVYMEVVTIRVLPDKGFL